MKINVEIDNTEHAVDIIKAEHEIYKCLVDGRDLHVNLSIIKQDNNISVYSIISNGTSYDVVVHKNRVSEIVCVNGITYSVKVKNMFDLIKSKEKKLHADGKGFKILAPIPGKVIAVKVDSGSNVKKGQSVIVIEAMKMENEIRTPVDGVITGIHVKEGDKVEKDTRLITIAF